MIPDGAVAAGSKALHSHYALEDGGINDFPPDEYDCCSRVVIEAAAHHLNRIITTVEELNALPGEAVLRNAEGRICEVWTLELGDGPSVMVYSVAGNPEDWPVERIKLPATVLWEPLRVTS